MGRRRRKGRNRHKQNGQDAGSQPPGLRGFLRRHAGATNGALAMLGLLIAALGLWLAFVSDDVSQNAKLSISDVTVTTKNGVTATDTDTGDVTGTRPVDVAAASIVLRNSGEEPAYINRLQVNVSRVWTPSGCFGGGPLETSVAYDFILPGDLWIHPRREPIVMSKDIQFEVEGKTLDSLAVTVGQEAIGEVEWPWITAATFVLIQDNGDSIETEPVVLMDASRIDHLMTQVEYQLDQDPAFAESDECIHTVVDDLEKAMATPGKKSAVIRELHDRLVRLGFGPQTSGSSTPAASGDTSDTWIAQLASLPRSTSEIEVEKARADVATRTGLEVRVLNSTDFASLTPGYWVLYSPGPFADGHQVLATCKNHGRAGEQLCVGRYLNHFEDHRDLVCRYSDAANSRHCTRN